MSVTGQRVFGVLRSVLPPGTPIRHAQAQAAGNEVALTIAGHKLRIRWLAVGWPRQVEEALRLHPKPDVVVAPRMSPGARSAAARAGLGWADESGAAEIHLHNLVVSRSGDPAVPLDSRVGWRPATLAVCEALLTGQSTATVSSVVAATGLSVGTAANSLKFLERDGFLESDAARGRESARRLTDPDMLLDAYAAAAQRLRSPTSIRVGVLWRDPLAGAAEIGRIWTGVRLAWAATGALSAAAIAPTQTEVAPMEIYVSARGPSDLRNAAALAGLSEIEGGRLLVRPFPTPAEDSLTTELPGGVRSMLWPRVYADLRTTGVRGEDAAEHLREVMAA